MTQEIVVQAENKSFFWKYQQIKAQSPFKIVMNTMAFMSVFAFIITERE